MTKLSSRHLLMSLFGIVSLTATVAAGRGPAARAQPAKAGSDVTVTIVADRGTVAAGQEVTYTVTMTNLGPDDTTFVDAALQIPDGLQPVSMACDFGVSPDGPFCEYTSLPAGTSAVSTLVATLSAYSPVHRKVVATAVTVLFENADAVDPDLRNNKASVKTKILDGNSHP